MMKSVIVGILCLVLSQLGQSELVEVKAFDLTANGEVLFSSSDARRLNTRELSMEALPSTVQLSFTTDGHDVNVELELERSRSLSEDLVVTFGDKTGTWEKPGKGAYSYRSLDGEWYLGFYHENSFEGVHHGSRFLSFKYEQGEFYVHNKLDESFRGGILEHLTYDLPEGRNARDLRDVFTNCYNGQGNLKSFKIGVTVGFALSSLFPTSNKQALIEQFVAVVTDMSNFLFEEQFSIRIEIASVVIAFDSSNTFPWNNPQCSNDISTQLFQLQRWTGRPRPGGLNLGLWHLLDRCFGFSGSTLGIAKLGVLCANSVNVGVSYATGNDQNTGTGLDLDIDGNFDAQKDLRGYPTWATYCHELGHNFGGSHSFEEGQGRTDGIMDYGTIVSRLIDGEIQFNIRYRRRDMCAEINSVASRCSAFADVPLPTASPTPLATSCTHFPFKVYRGVADVLAGEFSDFTVASCLAECDARPACKSFVVSETRGYCELWSKITTLDLDDTTSAESSFSTYICEAPDTTTDPNAPTAAPTVVERTCVLHRNRVFFGTADLYAGSYDSWTAQECFNACENAGCTTFIHSSRYGYCELWSTGNEAELEYYFGYNSYICQVGNVIPPASTAVGDVVAALNLSSVAEACCTTTASQYNLAGENFPAFPAESIEACTEQCVQEEGCVSASYNSEENETEVSCELFHVQNFTGTGADYSAFTTSNCSRTCIAQLAFPEPTEFDPTIGIVAAVAVVAVIAIAAFIVFRRRRAAAGRGVIAAKTVLPQAVPMDQAASMPYDTSGAPMLGRPSL